MAIVRTTTRTIFSPSQLSKAHSSFLPPSMEQHHLQAWSWEPAMSMHYRYQNLYLGEAVHEREHMFEKPLTPSDVGKLNRLVIPKQHAEKYFPLGGDSGEKGLLLSFEDESGKTWQFRYSYWTSSQSYVLTKGWSRFVKEKRLDAGDVVLFERARLGVERLFIGCRHRDANESPPCTPSMPVPATAYYGASYPNPTSSSCFSTVQQGDQRDEAVSETAAPANSKKLRLFGVNLEFPEPQPVSATSWFL